MMKKQILLLAGVCMLLSACSQNKNTEVSLTENAKKYESMSYGEYKLETGNEAEFYHGNLFTGEIPESSLCAVYPGEYEEETAGSVLADDSVPVRLQGELADLLNGIEKEVSLTELAESLSFDGGEKARYEILEGGGTAYYVGNIYALIQFDSDKDGEYDRQLSISMDQAEDETVDSESATWLERKEDAAAIYEPVLKEYREMVQNDFYRDRKDTDSFEESFGEYIGLEIRLREQDVYYAFHDIDGNGTEELLIAGGEHNGEEPASFPWNYDLYGYDGTKPVHIFTEMEFGYRTNFSLYEGVVEVFYSGSAAESGVDFYKIGPDGFSPELTASFLMVGHLEGDKPVFTYYQNDEEVTEEEYQSGILSCEAPLEKELEWIQIQ